MRFIVFSCLFITLGYSEVFKNRGINESPIIFFSSTNCSSTVTKDNIYTNLTLNKCLYNGSKTMYGFARLQVEENSVYASLQCAGTSLLIGSFPSPKHIGDVIFASVYPDTQCSSFGSVGMFMFNPNQPVIRGRCYTITDDIIFHVNKKVYQAFIKF